MWTIRRLKAEGVTALYRIGVATFEYQDTTVFGQLAETRPQHSLEVSADFRQPWGEFVLTRVPDAQSIVGGQESGIWGRITGVVSRVVEFLGNIVIILATGLYLAASPGLYRRGIVRLVPVQHRDRAREVLGAVGRALWSWLTGQFISMTIIGVGTWIGLMLLGIPLAFALGFIAGTFEFVPIIGPFASSVPAVESPHDAASIAPAITATSATRIDPGGATLRALRGTLEVKPTEAGASPEWLKIARAEIGQKEVPGLAKSNARVLEYIAQQEDCAKRRAPPPEPLEVRRIIISPPDPADAHLNEERKALRITA